MLSIIAGRIIGSLLEKQRTVPDQYPLSLNALVLACNQSSSREPVMALQGDEVELELGALKADGWLRFVHPSHGRSVTRYRQIADEKLQLDDAEAAVVALLMLRGPQTGGEIRNRSDRLHTFAGVEDVERVLRSLADRPTPLVRLLERQPGQKEPRWQQLVAEEAEIVFAADSAAGAGGGGGRAAAVVSTPTAALIARLDQLERRVAFLESQLGIELEAEPEPVADQVDGDA